MRSFVLTAILLCAISAKAQFDIVPNDTAIGVFLSDGYHSLNIDFPAADSASVTLQWTVLTNTLPAAWDRSVCDLPNCYFSIPSSATMSTYSDPQKGFLRLSFSPMTVAADAELRIEVRDLVSSQTDTVSFIISAVAATGADDPLSHDGFVRVIPGFNELTVTGQHSVAYHLAIFDIHGRAAGDHEIVGGASISIDYLVPGLYLARLTDDRGVSRTARIVVIG